jgi:hypothetical protein
VIISPSEKSCSSCGETIPADSLFCERCGQPLVGVPPEQLPNEPVARPYESPPAARVSPPDRPNRRTDTRFLLSVIGTAVAVILLFAIVIAPNLSSITGSHTNLSGGPSVTSGPSAVPSASLPANAAVKAGTVALQTVNGRYLTAVDGGGRTTDVIHSDATAIQSWEKFTLIRQGQ